MLSIEMRRALEHGCQNDYERLIDDAREAQDWNEHAGVMLMHRQNVMLRELLTTQEPGKRKRREQITRWNPLATLAASMGNDDGYYLIRRYSDGQADDLREHMRAAMLGGHYGLADKILKS